MTTDSIIDLTISMRGQAEDKQAEFAINDGERVRIELGRVYLVKTVYSRSAQSDSVFPHGTAFTLTKVNEAGTIVDTERIGIGGHTIETGWLECNAITELVPA